MALSNSGYRKWYAFYNSERRERAGGIYTFIRDTSTPATPAEIEHVYQWDFRNEYADVQRFRIDLNGTNIENPTSITMFTLSNGCKIKGEFYYIEQTNDGARCHATLKWVDANDNTIMENLIPCSGEFIAPDKYYTGLSNVDIWYNPPSYMYQYDELTLGKDANYFNYLGNIFTLRPNGSPYDPPVLRNGVVYDANNVATYYYWLWAYLTEDTDYEYFINELIEQGDGTPISPIVPSEDTSEPGGGDDADPDYNPFSDPVDFPGLPTGGGAIESGFIRVYNPTSAQLQALAGELWSSSFFNTIEKIMNDPMEAMISLHSVPFQLVIGDDLPIRIGNYQTQVSAKVIRTQYYTLNCGNISLPEHWASALDYSPYTTVDIFIPFVGVRPLQIDDVMGRVLNLKYNVDILTGSAIAMLKCGDSVLYTYNTQVITEIPYNMSSYGRLVQSIIGVAGTAIGAAAGGAGAIIGGGIGGALGTAMTKHSDISRGGALGGVVGVMGDFVPYLIIHRPIQSLAGDFASKKGYPSNISATLGSVSGYTVVDKIHLTGIDCTDTERDEIRALLKDGVII